MQVLDNFVNDNIKEIEAAFELKAKIKTLIDSYRSSLNNTEVGQIQNMKSELMLLIFDISDCRTRCSHWITELKLELDAFKVKRSIDIVGTEVKGFGDKGISVTASKKDIEVKADPQYLAFAKRVYKLQEKLTEIINCYHVAEKITDDMKQRISTLKIEIKST